MNKIALALFLVLAPLAASDAHAFSMVENAICRTDTQPVATFNDVIDGGGLGAYTHAASEVASYCTITTPPGGCCMARVRTNGGGIGGPLIPYTWFHYAVFASGSVEGGHAPGSIPHLPLANFPGSLNGTVGQQWKYLAGPAGCTEQVWVNEWHTWPAGTQFGALNEGALNPFACEFWAKSEGYQYWNAKWFNNPDQYDPTYSVCVGTNTAPTGRVPKPPFIGSIDTNASTSHAAGRVCPGTAAGVSVTASLVANPGAIFLGEQSLLTWSSTGATSCTGAHFDTGGRTAGSTLVSPTLTTDYTITCSAGGGSASATARVIVTQPTTCAGGLACSGNNVIDVCTGAIVQTCTTSCISGVASSIPTSPTPSVGGGSSTSQATSGTSALTTEQPNYCSLGTLIYSDSSTEDAVNFGSDLGAWAESLCGGVSSGQCCHATFLASPNPGAGVSFPQNSYYTVHKYSDSTSLPGPVFPLSCPPGYDCSSYALSRTTAAGGGSSTGTNTTAPGTSDTGYGGPSYAYCAPDNSTPGDPGTPGNPGTDTCPAGRMCVGLDVYDQRADCSREFVESCTFGCALGQCVDLNGGANAPDINFSARPPVVKKGGFCELTFSAAKVTRCTLTGPGINRSFTATNGIVSQSTVVSPALLESGKYTLTCMGTRTVTKIVECKIAPTFEEF